jgi:hypothetical protein
VTRTTIKFINEKYSLSGSVMLIEIFVSSLVLLTFASFSDKSLYLSSSNIPSINDGREALRLATDDSVLLSLELIEERTEKTIEKLIDY